MKFVKNSLYLKLLAIYSVTFLLLFGLVLVAIKSSRLMSIENSIRFNIQNYAQYLAHDIGAPPDLERAKEIQNKTKLDVVILGKDVAWSNNPHFLKYCEKSKEKRHFRRQVRVENRGYTYIFGGRNLKQPEFAWEIFLPFIAIFSIILFASYRLVKHVMKPIIDMKATASAFGEGKWDARVPLKSQDEFADLGSTMNSMAEKIETHFKNMKDLLLAISHELRSPLTRMRVTTEFIADENVKKSLNEEINHLDRITGMLLERERLSARPDILEKKMTNVSDIIQNVVKKYPETKVVMPIHESIPVDQNRFELALGTLLDNAYKHGKPPVEISLGADQNLIWIEVKDYGQGLPIEHIAKLGEPFFPSSKSAEGFGLGLSLAYSIFKAHGFALTAKKDDGCVFRIEIPRA
ncbi:HAMP domain-containing sensor histidine kinase [Peredibacter starrii]|uniref:histidine kinase n=1 Tax=Peredibacter starrii TaxID=28202 RepID=A0AAX4HUV2_9BACT|nr:HAMP domain-containing sensor histidine kinase [Peredibacter starrii]WPU67016.1 HAMP domain-containing sensor histidine kinase [Peredibacter starrii]